MLPEFNWLVRVSALAFDPRDPENPKGEEPKRARTTGRFQFSMKSTPATSQTREGAVIVPRQ